MEKVDLKKELKPLYQPSPREVVQFIESRSRLTGKHHEIYLRDIRKADPAKWKTIIRQPMV